MKVDFIVTLQIQLKLKALVYKRPFPSATPAAFSITQLFLKRELRTRLSLVRPDLTTHVSCPQGKMKMHHDTHAKFRQIAVGEPVLARDQVSGQGTKMTTWN